MDLWTRSFTERVARLPRLGLGVSTEFGAAAAPGALDVNALFYTEPRWAAFLEVGVETAKGLDRTTRAWAAHGLPTTYHFLDLNLDHPEDQDPTWLDQVKEIAATLAPAWVCGDAGLWHFGPRDRGHMLLLPPILAAETAVAMAAGIRRLRDTLGLEVLPENPPGQVFLGDLDLLDFFARLAAEADSGLLLDCAHLAIYQRAMGRSPLAGLDRFPLDRVVEMHVAGGTETEADGYRFVEDDHRTQVLPETWAIFEHVAPRAPNLRAVVFECERNPLAECIPVFERLARVLADSALAAEVAS
jgi:uncharacterized protein (UPF0276 family)